MEPASCVRAVIEETGTQLPREDVEAVVRMLIEYDQHPRNRQVFGPFSPEQGRIQDALENPLSDRLATARDTLMARARLIAAQQQANIVMDATKQAERFATYQNAPSRAMGVQAKLVGTNTPFLGSRNSAAAAIEGNMHNLVGTFDRELKAGHLDAIFFSRQMEREWALELHELNSQNGNPGVTNNPQALQLAQIIQNIQRRSVDMINREGGFIGSYDGYIARTTHSSDLIRDMGEDAWLGLANTYFDIPTIYPNRDAAFIDNALRDQYKRIVSGIHDEYDPETIGITRFAPGQNLARKVSESRVIHFKDGQSWLDYVAQASERTPTQIVLDSAKRASSDAALMRVFGTNPKAALANDLSRIEHEARDASDWSTLEEIRQQRRNYDLWLGYMTGENNRVVNKTWAAITSNTLAVQRLAKLGFLPFAQLTDLASLQGELRYQGVPFFERVTGSLSAYFRGGMDSEKRQVADLLNAYLEGELSDHGTLMETNDPRISGTFTGRMNQLQNWFFRATGATAMTNRARGSVMYMMARHMGQFHGQEFTALGEAERRIMSAFDIGEHEWNALRQANWTEGVEGNRYLTPRDAASIPDSAIDDYAKATGQGQSSVAAEPAVPQGMVRVYHSGSADNTGPRWVSTSRDYAANYRSDAPLHYLDLPENDPRINNADYPDQGVKQGFDFNFDLPANEANRMRVISRRDASEAVFQSNVDPAQFREDIANRLYSYYADRMNYGVLNPGVAERAIMYQGAAPDTALGTALRLAGQFKSFMVATIRRGWGREIYGGQGGLGAISGLMEYAVTGTILGIAANALNQLFKGQDPTSQWKNAPTAAVISGFTRAGVASIAGDFAFGNFNRNGQTVAGYLVGPSISTLEPVVRLLNAGLNPSHGPENAGGDALQLVRSMTPLVNSLYTKIAFDYLLWNGLTEAASPGYLGRLEQRQRESQGLEYLPLTKPSRLRMF